jgi:ABC-2 type transport system permease protein
MTALLRAELLKQRSTRTNLGLSAAMVGLVLLAVLLHGLSLPVGNLATRRDQLKVVFGWGGLLSAMFAGLVGAMSITGEFRHGTIRPTLLVSPRRGPVLGAKLATATLTGVVYGLVAAVVAAGAGAASLAARGLTVHLHAGDYAILVAGCAAAAALWALIGVGVGAVVRSQVPTVVGLCAWLFFVETIVLGDGDLLGAASRYTPGGLAKAAIGQEPKVAPLLAVALLAVYAGFVALAGCVSTTRRDIA